MRFRLWATLAVCALVVALAPGTASAATGRNTHGYLPLSDGTRLAYSLTRPNRSGRFPVALIMDHYNSGAHATADGMPFGSSGDPASFGVGAPLLKAGYAVLGVNQRGSGCSGGFNDWMNADQWGKDGAEVVEWAAKQGWSTGHVGMFGLSWPGITQIGTAGHRPPHLDAITPFSVATDFYRDISYPGGIYDVAFMSAYGALVGAFDVIASQGGLTGADSECGANFGSHAGRNETFNAAVHMPTHPFRDKYWAKSPDRFVDKINVPLLGCEAWQDGSLSSRATALYFERFDQARSWFIGRNGVHGSCNTPQTAAMIVKFLDRYVKGIDNGWDSTPHITLFHEMKGDKPRWVSTIRRWQDAMKPASLQFHADGSMTSSAPGRTEAPRAYLSPAPAQSGQWTNAPAPNTFLSYTTPRLTQDAEFLGPGSVNLWLSSTTSDADLEASISEVRPDGQEQYVASGWLRISHRRLDPHRSTALRPFQTHTLLDLQPLVPDQPTYARIELFPFDHVFRSGSSIRLTIGSAAGPSYGLIGFAASPAPAINTVYQDRAHDSRLVLGLVPAARAHARRPACGSVDVEPCRPNSTTVPAGTLTLE